MGKGNNLRPSGVHGRTEQGQKLVLGTKEGEGGKKVGTKRGNDRLFIS